MATATKWTLPLSLAAFAGALASANASAVTVIGHCVSTAQELQNALTASSDGGQYNGFDNRIKIVAGLYQTRLVGNPSPGAFSYQNSYEAGKLSIEGGYNSDCSARSPNPLATLLDGNSTYQVMQLHSTTASIEVSGLTIENGETDGSGGGLRVNDVLNEDGPVEIFDVVVRNNHTTTYGGGIDAGSGGFDSWVTVHNALIIDNRADGGESGVMISGDGAGVRFYDNTVTGNTLGSGAENSVYIVGTAAWNPVCEMTNNIINRNPGGGLEVVCDGGGTLSYNDIGTINADPSMVETGNVSVDPGFVDEDGGDYHLASTSRLLGFSPMLVNEGTDLDGFAYPASGRQDIGAYEDTLFVDGLDGD